MLLLPMVTRAMRPTTVRMTMMVTRAMRPTTVRIVTTVRMTSAVVVVEVAAEEVSQMFRSYHHCKYAQECLCP